MCQILPKGVVSVIGPASSPASGSTVSHICGEKEVSVQDKHTNKHKHRLTHTYTNGNLCLICVRTDIKHDFPSDFLPLLTSQTSR